MRRNDAPESPFRVREFRPAEDVPAVAEILRESPEAACWSEQELRELPSLAGVSAFVAERGNILTGFIVGRRVVDEAEILNLAVRRSLRRQGEGLQLLARLLFDFDESNVSRVFLEVRESNATAISFYQALGFRPAGKRKDYYQNPPESATVMETWLRESTDGTKRS